MRSFHPPLALITWTIFAFAVSAEAAIAAPFGGPNDSATLTPIKHVIIIVGENRSFDHVFATYRPPAGQTVLNLLSQGIVNADGTPGPNFAQAQQNRASDTSVYKIDPTIIGPYITLPPPNTGHTHEIANDRTPPPWATAATAGAADAGILPSAIILLTEGASGLPTLGIDTRIPNARSLPPGPFQLSPGISVNAYTGDPVHRFYQMWQQTDCAAAHATAANPSGCNMDLYPWTAVTAGAGTNDKPRPNPFTDESTGQGGNSMGFYNMASGDLGFFAKLAGQYTLGDNFHQAVMGGTAANSIMVGTADILWYSDGHGHPIAPPAVQIQNPNPQPGTNNWYTEDGYPGGAYTECADTTAPGVAPIIDYLRSLPYHPSTKCQPGIYYLVDNHSPGYFGNGTVNTSPNNVEPPSATPTIANTLLAHGVSWTYYGEGWNAYVQNPNVKPPVYCAICNPFQYETAVMSNAAVRTNDLKDTSDLYTAIADGNLPAVSYVKPGTFNDAHPVGSKLNILGSFIDKILIAVEADKALAANTAIFITFDESGGYYDSGYLQPIDFFGDGPRIPLIVISRYSRGGAVVHNYADHASIIKFIEKNWNLPTISKRSRDNLPNPLTSSSDPYVPTNLPAIDDLMDFFHF